MPEHTVPRTVPPALAWLQAVREPAVVLGWSLADWERVVRLSRRTRLLARLADALLNAGLLDQVPEQARRHLRAELRLSVTRTTAAVWALQRVAAALEGTDYPLVLLKGAAYIGQDLPIAGGRLPSDLDILVPREHIADAQQRLADTGWSEGELDEHDRKYYHEWSHEVPPMQSPLHALELDLHHNILPPVARTNVDAGALLARLRPCRFERWQVLHPIDQVLHSAAHLFLDAEPSDRVRDLVDLDGLLRHFSTLPGFWEELPLRARALGLAEPLALASHFTRHWLCTPIPESTWRHIERLGPGTARQAWLLPLMGAVLAPADPDQPESLGKELAAQIVLARYHRQRLPLRLLVPHLWRKWRLRSRAADNAVAEPPPL